MKTVVVDASVVSKWYLEEENSDKALEIRTLYTSGKLNLAAPVLVLYEVGNTLRKHPAITSEDATKAFSSLLEMRMDLRSFVESDSLKKTFEATRNFNITFYDGLYVSLAQFCSAIFVTADDALYNKIAGRINAVLLRKAKVENLL